MKSEKQVHIIYSKYYDFDTKQCTLGGIQTYLRHLIPVFGGLGFQCCLYQTGYHKFEKVKLNGLTILNVPTEKIKKWDDKVKVLLKEVEKSFHDETDILLFATDCQMASNHASKSIAIQHGITWDVPVKQDVSVSKSHLFMLRKMPSLWKKVNRLSMAKRVVCVDHNFVNWYRASVAYEAVPTTVIPNFTPLAPRYEKGCGKINIIFARRLEVYRGTRLFSDVMQRILKEYDNVELTVAGKGPDEAYMRDKLGLWGDRVKFITYQPEDSLRIHSDKHIAVVPTIGSEGTSLSLLEAMSAQCAVVCTNIGGMTNIVLDGYNGLLVSPREEALYMAIKKLIEDEKMRMALAKRGYDTVSNAFSLEKWQEKWKELIVEITQNEVL